MLVYLAIFAGLALISLVTPDRRSLAFFAVSSVFLVWFMGFRYETGCDYQGYLNRWINFQPPKNVGELLAGSEAGFNLLVTAVRSAGLGYTWLNVAASVILVVCYVGFARAHRYAPLILALLFPVIIIQLGMSGIRQALAGAFLMLAMNAFMQGKRLWTGAWILVGMQFHTSVVMFLPMALLAGREISTIRLALSLAILGPVASLLLADRFDTYSDRYIDQVSGAITSGGALIRYFLVALPVPLFFLYRHKLIHQFPRVYSLLKLNSFIILSLFPLVFLSSIALHRLNYYMMPGSILLCVYVGAVAFQHRREGPIIFKKRVEGQALAILAYGAYSLSWFMTSDHSQACYVPYNNTMFLSYPPMF